jgi:ArsR family transcriptional regulator, arsenate/arsenite/antimonite-responsive transcriptional repressor
MKIVPNDVIRFADMMAAMGAEPRLRIMRSLLSAHPRGMVVGDIQAALGIPGSTLSHHLEKLKNEGLVSVRRERQFLRYAADTEVLQQLLSFLYEECCSGQSSGRTGPAPGRRRGKLPNRSMFRERR